MDRFGWDDDDYGKDYRKQIPFVDPVKDKKNRVEVKPEPITPLEKRVFKVDVGNIPKKDMKRYIREVANKFTTERWNDIEENPKYIVEINFNPRNFEYESVWMNLNGYKVAEQFGTGNFIKDWFDAMNYFISNAQQGDYVMFGSTIPIFTGHHPEFDSAYLVKNDGFLGFVDLPLSFQFRESEKVRFFVPRNTILTWEDLKRICTQ